MYGNWLVAFANVFQMRFIRRLGAVAYWLIQLTRQFLLCYSTSHLHTEVSWIVMHETLSAAESADHDDLLSVDSLNMFEHQVGGHHVIVKHPTRPDLIVKSYFAKEVRFYHDAQRNSDLLSVMSKFHGIMVLAPFGGSSL